MKPIVTLAASASLFGTAPAFAEDNTRFSIGITAGTLGIGPEAIISLGDKFAVRANATFLSLSRGFDSDDVAYNGDIDFRSGGLMLDFHPTGGGFRVTGGARINGNKASVSAAPTATVTINNTNYTSAQVGTLRGSATTKDLAPLLMIGYTKRSKGLAFGIEAGALFQGNVRINNFTASGGGVATADLEAERRSIQDDVNGYKVYPILQLSVGYRF